MSQSKFLTNDCDLRLVVDYNPHGTAHKYRVSVVHPVGGLGPQLVVIADWLGNNRSALIAEAEDNGPRLVQQYLRGPYESKPCWEVLLDAEPQTCSLSPPEPRPEVVRRGKLEFKVRRFRHNVNTGNWTISCRDKALYESKLDLGFDVVLILSEHNGVPLYRVPFESSKLDEVVGPQGIYYLLRAEELYPHCAYDTGESCVLTAISSEVKRVT